MWKVHYEVDPLCPSAHGGGEDGVRSVVARGSVGVRSFLLADDDDDDDDDDDGRAEGGPYEAFLEGGRTSAVALADAFARTIAELAPVSDTVASSGASTPTEDGDDETETVVYTIEPLGKMLTSIDPHHGGHGRGSRHLRRAVTKRLGKGTNNKKSLKEKKKRGAYPPYILERTDVWSDGTTLNVSVRIIAETGHENADAADGKKTTMDSSSAVAAPAPAAAPASEEGIAMADAGAADAEGTTPPPPPSRRDAFFLDFLKTASDRTRPGALRRVACAVLQDRLRSRLPSLSAVAFVADGSILPRRSGASSMPMASPPAVPLKAPVGSNVTEEICVDMGRLRGYLDHDDDDDKDEGGGALIAEEVGKVGDKAGDTAAAAGHVAENDGTTVRLTGLIIPKGVTLIVGGGYHGKSTLLRTIAAGVYNKIAGDGRERCVTISDAVTVRAEDGRYVNKCNVSAFISNLPTPPGVTTAIDTTQFSTGEASGSTSQASNVSEAIEMGSHAMLVDEDVSAANFMARDGRMRSIVMDESITPLLYRVNGMYNTLGIPSVVVVGGVGDWLDVPHNVIKMDKYLIYDATEKARSVSKQFSHGHVQYAGRGVVHRLPWDRPGTPNQRRPTNAWSNPAFRNARVSLMDGGGRIALAGDYNDEDDDGSITEEEDEDDDLGVIDMSRCEQLMGRSEQLYGCGLCVAWVLKASEENPTLGLCDLLDQLDTALDQRGLNELLFPASPGENNALSNGHAPTLLGDANTDLLESLGFAYRPRRYEVAMALTRMRGIRFEEIPIVDDGSEAYAQREAEERKKALAELWAKRRKKAGTTR